MKIVTPPEADKEYLQGWWATQPGDNIPWILTTQNVKDVAFFYGFSSVEKFFLAFGYYSNSIGKHDGEFPPRHQYAYRLCILKKLSPKRIPYLRAEAPESKTKRISWKNIKDRSIAYDNGFQTLGALSKEVYRTKHGWKILSNIANPNTLGTLTANRIKSFEKWAEGKHLVSKARSGRGTHPAPAPKQLGFDIQDNFFGALATSNAASYAGFFPPAIPPLIPHGEPEAGYGQPQPIRYAPAPHPPAFAEGYPPAFDAGYGSTFTPISHNTGEHVFAVGSSSEPPAKRPRIDVQDYSLGAHATSNAASYAGLFPPALPALDPGGGLEAGFGNLQFFDYAFPPTFDAGAGSTIPPLPINTEGSVPNFAFGSMPPDQGSNISGSGNGAFPYVPPLEPWNEPLQPQGAYAPPTHFSPYVFGQEQAPQVTSMIPYPTQTMGLFPGVPGMEIFTAPTNSESEGWRRGKKRRLLP